MNTRGLDGRPRAQTAFASFLRALPIAAAMLLPSHAHAEPTAKDEEALTKAFAAQDANDWATAKALADKAPAIVRDLVQWRYVSAAASGATLDEIDAFLNTHQSWPGRAPIVQRGEEALLANALMESKGPAWFKARPPRTSAGCLAWAKYQFAHDQKAEALAGIRRCWTALTLSFADYQTWAADTQMPLDEADHLARADALLWNRNVSGARELLPLLPETPQRVVRARADIQSGTAVDIDDVEDDAPSKAWAASLYFDQAVRLRKAGKNDDAWESLIKADDVGAFSQAYSQAWWVEHNLQARNARDVGEYETAHKLASRTHLTADINIAAFLDAEFLAGWIALRYLDEPKKALIHFQNLEAAARSPITRARAAYWKSLALKARDRDKEAEQSLARAAAEPSAFYGRLAFEVQAGAAQQPTSTAPPASTIVSGEHAEDLVEAAAILLRTGDNRRANAFANAAIDACASASCAATLSARLARAGNTYGAVRSAKKAQTLGGARQSELYPLIDLPAACGTAGVPTALVHALIRQETEFDPSAISTANARGLMQVLPSTAQDVARRYGLSYAGPGDLLKPEINLALGCYHLKDMLDGLGGSKLLAIAAYNAGKARILGWIAARGDPRDPKTDVIDWIEAIPFDETRNYVMRVLENELAYKTRRGETLALRDLHQTLGRGP
jgi:soluble lytic murein transglycosylase